MEKTEKKVEYLELIYDLIFVYIIGRNHAILDTIQGGFLRPGVFLAYLLGSMAVIQIWLFSTYYINMYGRNGLRDHIFLFVNMYLLYYIGEGTRLRWQSFQTQYHVAWALILLNLVLAYVLERRNHREDPLAKKAIDQMIIVLASEAVLVLLLIPVFSWTGRSLPYLPILWGTGLTAFFDDPKKAEGIDFSHLSERAMLYVVFTFGEMVIQIASYFDGAFTLSSVYFSGLCFLIVVGLFLCYEVLYDKIIDRKAKITGMGYMQIHVVLIFALNNLTTALGYMRLEQVENWPKVLFLTGSFLLYFLCLLALLLYAKGGTKIRLRYLTRALIITAVFALLMLLLRERMTWNILLTAITVYAIFAGIIRYSLQTQDIS